VATRLQLQVLLVPACVVGAVQQGQNGVWLMLTTALGSCTALPPSTEVYGLLWIPCGTWVRVGYQSTQGLILHRPHSRL